MRVHFVKRLKPTSNSNKGLKWCVEYNSNGGLKCEVQIIKYWIGMFVTTIQNILYNIHA